MTATLAVLRNELERVIRHRWGVLAACFGLLLVVFGIGYGTFVYQTHLWVPKTSAAPTQAQRQSRLEAEIKGYQNDITQSQAQSAQVPAAFQGALKRQQESEQRAIDSDRFLLAHLNDVAPSDTVTAYVIVVLLGYFFFVFSLTFGWLGSELLAGERSSKTMSLVLSRPVSRAQLLAGKFLALVPLAIAVVLVAVAASLLAVDGFLRTFDLGQQLYLVVDDTRALSDSNTVVLPVWLFVLMCSGVAVVALLTVTSMGLLFSSFLERAGVALGLTLAALFVGPVVTGAIGTVASAFGQGSPRWLDYVLFTNLTPVSRVPLSNFSGGGGGGGLQGLETSLLTLTIWGIALLGGAWLVFRRKQETA